jgi:enoyl-CoA hydratase/carnithine racemase
MNAQQPYVLYELADGIATLTLNLPAKLNPIARELQIELRDALERIRDDRAVRAVILTGAGKAFCVGADLSAMATGDEGKSLGTQTAEWMQSLSNPLIETLRTLPVPVVAAVNGAAAGAGVGLALAADVTIAARSAYFYLPFLPKLGIVPDLGCTWAIPRRAGKARAMGMALLDERLSAARGAMGPDLGLRRRRTAARRSARDCAAARPPAGACGARSARSLRSLRTAHAGRTAALRKRTPARADRPPHLSRRRERLPAEAPARFRGPVTP